MEVILNKDVESIGKAGCVVNVKEGFARNFLFPHNLAKPATQASLKKLEEEKKVQADQLAKAKEGFLVLKDKLDRLSLNISALAQDGEKLYGSIHPQDIADALKKEGFAVEKNAIDLPESIKSLGIYEIKVKLHPEVIAKFKLWVVRK
ncbi:MAG: 50S ribosomal protein L9 [Candidatus Omnitrophota bacterium]